jgi:hypothetical protein
MTSCRAYEIDSANTAMALGALQLLRAAITQHREFRATPGVPAWFAMPDLPPALIALLDDDGELGEWLAMSAVVGLLAESESAR